MVVLNMTCKQVIRLQRGWNRMLFLILLLMAAPLLAEPPAAATTNMTCLRCHGMKTLAYRHPSTGKIVDLFVEQVALSHSVHGKLACTECHDGDFAHYPHRAETQQRSLSCVKCHEQQDDATKRHYQFTTIDAEYAKSIHATSDAVEAAAFNCHSCHDPHRFHASQIGDSLATIIHNDNALCLTCHEQARLKHAWLPNRERHWETVRCLDCHTPVTDSKQPVSHHILSAADSNHDCVSCHSKNSQLLNRLYRYRAANDVASHGWLNTAIFNEAYVVGMSRSAVLDRLALVIIGLTLCVLLAHGIGRYRAQQRLLRKQQ